MSNDNGIETGIESDERADATARDIDPDLWAYADDGEYATSWAIKRVDETTILVEYHYHEAGLDDIDGLETFVVDEDATIEEIARDIANANPEGAIEDAREHFQ